MKKTILNIGIAVLIIGFSVWLYANDQASEPGELSSAHQFIGSCEICHIPWQGASNQNCLQCHYFEDVSALKPQIRFHEAQKYCLNCHTEHRGPDENISEVNHRLFNGDLSCTQCHFEVHDGKFGDDCRACHGITTWDIKGFQHPPANNLNCHQCHAAPASHGESSFWDKILKGHREGEYKRGKPVIKECWQCHTTHRWGHRMMAHEL